jgi:hypothetical protein
MLGFNASNGPSARGNCHSFRIASLCHVEISSWGAVRAQGRLSRDTAFRLAVWLSS